MSDHTGSYMLNDSLTFLEKEDIFDEWGKDKTQDLLIGLVTIAKNKKRGRQRCH